MAAGKGWVERRRFQRVEACLNARYSVLEEEVGRAAREDANFRETRMAELPQSWLASPVMQAVTQDISEGGLSLVCDQDLPLGTYLLVEIGLPKAGASIRALAMVMRQELGAAKDSTSGLLRVGLQMVALDRMSLQSLQGLLLERLMSSGRPGALRAAVGTL